jgi:putative FmdB family regulatory protein
VKWRESTLSSEAMMPTYEYECETCGLRFERRLAITEQAITECPECRGKIFQRISGGSGFIIKGNSKKQMGMENGNCSLEALGRTCCGREERCGKPPCEEG